MEKMPGQTPMLTILHVGVNVVYCMWLVSIVACTQDIKAFNDGYDDVKDVIKGTKGHLETAQNWRRSNRILPVRV